MCHWTLNQSALIISYSTSLPQGDKNISFCLFSSLLSFTINNFFYFFIFFSFPRVLLVQKMQQTVQTLGQNLFLGKTCPSEFWWVNAALVVHLVVRHTLLKLWAASKIRSFFPPPRVRQRQSHRVKRIKKFYLPLLQNHRRRKPPQRRVMRQIWRSKTGTFKTDCYYYTHSMLLGPANVVKWETQLPYSTS